MALEPATKLGSYEVIEAIGAGGMGEVYRARDTKLGRDVAIKILPAEMADDTERLARFRREAQLLASLNHPHIAAIYGLEEAEGKPFLVLELVEGSDLSERLSAGPLSLAETISIAKQISEALEEGHAKGVIHRDLKPGNIKVTADGTVKVLDYGLAKAFSRDGQLSPDLSQSPTLTRQATAAGILLGTPAYMSPEQAKGDDVDRRSDIWSFGCVLYELLTGRKAFLGETLSETLAEILKSEPAWKRLPASTPASVRRLLERCLAKDLKHRLRDIGEAWVVLDEPGQAPVSTPRRDSRRVVLGAVLGALLGALAFWLVARPEPADPANVSRFVVKLRERLYRTGGLTLSPSASHLAYVADIDGTLHLVLRDLARLDDEILTGTEDAFWPFFSPDGEWIGFLTRSQRGFNEIGALKKIAVRGGAPITLRESVFVGAAFWADDDTIVFQPPSGGGFLRMPERGGSPEPVPGFGSGAQNSTPFPLDWLPGRDALLTEKDVGAGRIELRSLATDERLVVSESGGLARYVPSGHIVYAERGRLMAVPLDPAQFALAGAAVPVAEGVHPWMWAFSRNGTLVYQPEPKRKLVWVHRNGTEEPLAAPSGYYRDVRLSPDGSRLALVRDQGSVGNVDVWVLEMERETLSRFTVDPAIDRFPLWSLDGQRLIFRSWREDDGFYGKAADGSGSIEHILANPFSRWPYSWSEGGEQLVYEENNPVTGSDVGMLSMDGEGILTPIIQEPFDQMNPAVSPDGRWIAYESNETGRSEVYVQRFPQAGNKRKISSSGGAVPLWGRNGEELFFRNGNDVMVVPVEKGPTFAPGTAEVLFSGEYLMDPVGGTRHRRGYDYDVRRDRFLMVKLDESQYTSTELAVVVNWFEELKRLAPHR